MRVSVAWVCAGMVTVLVSAATVARADEKKVPLDEVSKPVLEAVKARFKDSQLTGASQEAENGKLVSEVSIVHKGQSIDITLTPDGEILEIEKRIPAESLPEAALRALQDKYPGAIYRTIEETIEVENKQERPAYYEVKLVAADQKRLEVKVTAQGMILEE